MSIRRSILHVTARAALVLCATLAPVAFAHAAQHVRGTIAGVEGQVLSVKTADGAVKALKLGDKTGVFAVKKIELAAVTKDKFVGITSVEKDGMRVAREVHVFDESLRGRNEGHYPWDLDATPNMMTNANVATVNSVGAGRMLKLDYKGGEQTILVPESAPIVAFSPSTRAELTAGRKAFVILKDGIAAGVVVGLDGVTPPM